MVPNGCELRFENTSVIAVTDGLELYDAGVNVVGPVLGDGRWRLMLVRTENGVEISGR